jgi:hypothetical protein
VLDKALYEDLEELQGFHHHGFDLQSDKVQANVDRAIRSLPVFVYRVRALFGPGLR